VLQFSLEGDVAQPVGDFFTVLKRFSYLKSVQSFEANFT
jgi:hypothetical protein